MTNEELNKWLADEIMVYSGCCSSIECLKYDIAKETAIKMAAWKEQQMIQRAVDWFDKNWTMYTYPSHLMFEDFKKAMKGE